jgi:hypothetical protein
MLIFTDGHLLMQRDEMILNRMILGAANELTACVHLMRQGYDVYRCQAPTAPFDLVAHKAGQLWRVEVKSIAVSADGRHVGFGWPKNDQWDMLILVNVDFCHVVDPQIDRDTVRRDLHAHYGVLDARVASHVAVHGPLAPWVHDHIRTRST